MKPYKGEGKKEVQRAFLPEGPLALSFCVLLVLTPDPSTFRVQVQESNFTNHAFRL